MLGARQGLSQELGTEGEVEHCRVICSGNAREPHICKQTNFLHQKYLRVRRMQVPGHCQEQPVPEGTGIPG